MDRSFLELGLVKKAEESRLARALWIEVTFMYPFDVIDNVEARESLVDRS